jgi:ribosomal protein S17E
MGRIKSKAIKRNARELVNIEPTLTENFEENKEILNQYDLPDKGTRNKISGFIVRLKKAERLEKPLKD